MVVYLLRETICSESDRLGLEEEDRYRKITIPLTDIFCSGIYYVFMKCFTADPSALRLRTMLA